MPHDLTVIAGPVPAIPIHSLRDLSKKITPFCIALANKSRFPSAWPMLDILFALYRLIDRAVDFEIYQFVDAIPFCMSGYQTIFVLIHAANQISRYTSVDRTTRSTREDIDKVLRQTLALLIGMAGTSPAMTI
jgi:hypothetical protein